jgi:Zn-dependent protease
MSVEQEAKIAFAGPFLGTAGALAVLWMSGNSDSKLLLAVAYAGFFLNLFNLIPVTPFDGGRIVAILSPKIWFIGVPILGAVFFINSSPMFLLILILLAPTIWRSVMAAWRGEVPEHNPRYYDASPAARSRYATYYILLLVFLCVMTYETHERLLRG